MALIHDKNSINILVGLNYFWSTVTGDLRREKDGPVAVNLGGYIRVQYSPW